MPSFLGSAATVNATNNTFTGFANGVEARQQSNVNNVVRINNNSLSGNVSKSLKSGTAGPGIPDASGNWYGSSNFATVLASITSSGFVDATPYLNSGTEANQVQVFVAFLNSSAEPNVSGGTEMSDNYKLYAQKMVDRREDRNRGPLRWQLVELMRVVQRCEVMWAWKTASKRRGCRIFRGRD